LPGSVLDLQSTRDARRPASSHEATPKTASEEDLRQLFDGGSYVFDLFASLRTFLTDYRRNLLMAEKRPAPNPPGKSINTAAGWSNLPSAGIQGGPRIGFSSSGFEAPQIQPTGGLSAFSPGRSHIVGQPNLGGQPPAEIASFPTNGTDGRNAGLEPPGRPNPDNKLVGR
jgi:hypothetical protein